MRASTVSFVLEQNIDEQGNPEEFTADAFLVVERSVTDHLEDNGLPRIGTRIVPGMCVIGKFGASREFERSRMPQDLEVLTADETELIARYGKMFYDGSLYAPANCYGEVVASRIEEVNGIRRAVVEILFDESSKQ